MMMTHSNDEDCMDFNYFDSTEIEKYIFPHSVPQQQIQLQNSHCKALLAQCHPSTQMMIVLYGIPGSGKSTFARRMVKELYPHNPLWVSFNQDVLGSRKAVERHARDSLQSGYNVIIDRCNFDVEQRKHWLQLAWEHSFQRPTTAIHSDQTKCYTICFVMPDSENTELCTKRAYRRGNDGIHEVDTEWNVVCARMKASLRYPQYEEGFDAIYHATKEEEIQAFLEAMAYMGCNYYAPLESQYHTVNEESKMMLSRESSSSAIHPTVSSGNEYRPSDIFRHHG